MDVLKRRSVKVAAVAAVGALMVPGAAFGKITPVCHNPGGQEPQGNCQGSALTEVNENPSGKAPPGQNK